MGTESYGVRLRVQSRSGYADWPETESAVDVYNCARGDRRWEVQPGSETAKNPGLIVPLDECFRDAPEWFRNQAPLERAVVQT